DARLLARAPGPGASWLETSWLHTSCFHTSWFKTAESGSPAVTDNNLSAQTTIPWMVDRLRCRYGERRSARSGAAGLGRFPAHPRPAVARARGRAGTDEHEHGRVQRADPAGGCRRGRDAYVGPGPRAVDVHRRSDAPGRPATATRAHPAAAVRGRRAQFRHGPHPGRAGGPGPRPGPASPGPAPARLRPAR